MRDDDIPAKTDAGLAEIKTRSLGLAPRVRTALLLVDGMKSIGELNQLLAASGVKPGTLELLAEKGLIRVLAQERPGMQAQAAAPAIASTQVTVSRADAAPAPKEVGPAAAVPAPKAMPAPASPATEPVGMAPAPSPTPEAKAQSAPKTPSPPKAEPARKTEPIPRAEPALQPEPAPAAASPSSTIRTPKAAAAPASIAPASAPVGMPAPEQDDRYDTEAAPRISIPVPAPPEDMKLVVARAHLASALDEHVGVQAYVLKQMVVGCASRAELMSLFDAAEAAMSKSLDKAGSARIIGISKALLAS